MMGDGLILIRSRTDKGAGCLRLMLGSRCLALPILYRRAPSGDRDKDKGRAGQADTATVVAGQAPLRNQRLSL